LGRIAAVLAGVPNVIHTVHGFAFPFATNRFTRYFYFAAEFIGGLLSKTVVVLNPTDYEYAIKYLRIPKRKVRLIPNGVNMDAFGKITGESRHQYRKDVLGVDGDTLCIAMVGRLWTQKNPLCLVDASKKVLQQSGLRVKFVLVGEGELRTEVENRIAEHKVADSVEVLGWRSDVPTLLSCVDMFVLPSLWEGMPLAILEAMASGVPVVVSDIPGNCDLVDHAVDGLLFEPNNSDDLAEQILKLVDDPKLRTRLSAAAYAKVSSKYSLTQRLAKITELYAPERRIDTVNKGEGHRMSY
jgi:glycosyltransferase involved in cell wall biosynthesis